MFHEPQHNLSILLRLPAIPISSPVTPKQYRGSLLRPRARFFRETPPLKVDISKCPGIVISHKKSIMYIIIIVLLKVLTC